MVPGIAPLNSSFLSPSETSLFVSRSSFDHERGRWDVMFFRGIINNMLQNVGQCHFRRSHDRPTTLASNVWPTKHGWMRDGKRSSDLGPRPSQSLVCVNAIERHQIKFVFTRLATNCACIQRSSSSVRARHFHRPHHHKVAIGSISTRRCRLQLVCSSHRQLLNLRATSAQLTP